MLILWLAVALTVGLVVGWCAGRYWSDGYDAGWEDATELVREFGPQRGAGTGAVPGRHRIGGDPCRN